SQNSAARSIWPERRSSLNRARRDWRSACMVRPLQFEWSTRASIAHLAKAGACSGILVSWRLSGRQSIMTEMSMDKPTLRREAILRRDQLDERQRRSAQICSQILAAPAYAAAQTIHCYLSMRSEVDTRPLIADALRRGKGVIVPIVVPKAEQLFH